MSEANGHVANIDAEPVDLTFVEVAARLWRGKLWILVVGALGLLAAVLYLNRQTFLYTATMKVTAAASSQNSGSSRLGGLSGLASIAGVSMPSAGGASPFDLYLETLTSEDVAHSLARDPSIMRVVFASDWDPVTQRWREPSVGVKSRLVRAIKHALGLPVKSWNKPGYRELAGFLAGQTSIERDVKSPIVTVSLDHPDPVFAMRLLEAVSTRTDQLIRRSALDRSRDYAQYLERKLPTVTVAEQRAALVEVLGEQEKSIMMASSSAPYAATVVSGPTVSPLPTKPNGMTILIAGTALGLVLGALAALIDFTALRTAFRRARAID